MGRGRELAEIERLLGTSRLLTLTGAGGAGKTRLALEAAGALRAAYPDGVWLAELAALADPALVPQAVAEATAVREQPGRPLAATLADALRPRRLLLVLDNCEHLLEACARLAHALLRACPSLTIVATSREVLGIAGETAWRVPPLALPDPHAPPTAAGLRRSEAVLLFLDRALATAPSFRVTDANAPAVAQVCHRLDGLPLALELAAARVRVLAVEQLAARLDDRFRLLTRGARTALPRQQTLAATIDWSYALLAAPERALFDRLSVFAGGWTLAAGEAICAGDGLAAGDVLDLLTRLVDASLVEVAAETAAGEARYRLLETLREYGARRLAAGGPAAGEAVRARHAAHFLALAERAAPELAGPDQGRWVERLEREHDNLRAALGSALGAPDGETALRLGAALWPFWDLRGDNAEGRRWLERVLHGSGTTPSGWRVSALLGAGVLAWNQEDDAAARPLLEAGLALARELQDDRAIAAALNALGDVARHQGRYGDARSLHEASLARCRAAGDRRGAAAALRGLGDVARRQGDPAAAAARYEQSLALARSLGDRRAAAWVLHGLALVADVRGDAAQARARYEAALAAFRELGDRRGAALALANVAALDLQQGDPAGARARYAAALAAFRELGDRRGVSEALGGLATAAASLGDDVAAKACIEEAVAIARGIGDRQAAAWLLFELVAAAGRCGDQALARSLHQEALATGQELGDPRAIARWRRSAADSLPPPGGPWPTTATPGPLSPREREVAALVARGLTNRQIAARLVITERTVATHVEHILDELALTSRVQIGLWAAAHGLGPPPAPP